MLTGGDILRLIGWAYIGAAGLAIILALVFANGVRNKVLAALVVLVLFSVWPLMSLREDRQRHDEHLARLNASMALLQERCKSAGEKISRTIENVDGVVWMKWRGEKTNQGDQFRLDDPYGQDCGGEDCIAQLLRAEKGRELNPEEAKRHSKGYGFVETIDPRDGIRYRYTGVIKLSWSADELEAYKKRTGGSPPAFSYTFSLNRESIDRYTARYGITWDDISTSEDREHWIAGGSLKVVDLQTNEILAERVGYMMDRGQGGRAGFRSPWLFAVQDACPEFPHEPTETRRGRTLHETRDFVLKVLRQQKGE